MSKQYDNSNRFVLFPNSRKEADKHPDLTGTIHIGDQPHFFDAWITWDGREIARINGKIGQAKTGGKSGGGYGGGGNSGGGTRQRRELRDNMPQRQETRGGTEAYDDDDIPFIPYQRKVLW